MPTIGMRLRFADLACVVGLAIASAASCGCSPPELSEVELSSPDAGPDAAPGCFEVICPDAGEHCIVIRCPDAGEGAE